MASPSLTPLHTRISPLDKPSSPSTTPSYKTHIRRRTSSFSSNHDRSPVTPRSSHRFSNASAYSGESATPIDELRDTAGVGGMGNLADELGQLDDDEEEEVEDESAHALDEVRKAAQEATRDSGIDVSYLDKSEQGKRLEELQSSNSLKPPDPKQDADDIPQELEDAMNDISRLLKQSDVAADPLIPRFTKNLQNLGNQSNIDNGFQRLNTSTNSMSAHLTKETKTVQLLSTASLSPFGFNSFFDQQALDDSIPLIDALIKQLPVPEAQCSQDLSKLSHETEVVTSTLSSLLDTLQMGKQFTNTAARHLRTTQTMVTDLLRDGEMADLARIELSKSDVEQKIEAKWAAQQCHDIVSGFDTFCDDLKSSFIQSIKADA